MSFAESSPTRPAMWHVAPRVAMFIAVFAAPPGAQVSFLTCTTGTGASGLMRVTSPQMNLSSMTSPITRILAFGKSSKSWMSRRVSIG